MNMLEISEIQKIILVTNVPNPYRIPLFNELSKELSKKKIDLRVIFGSRGYNRRKWNLDFKECEFDYEILNSHKIRLGKVEKTMFTYSGLLKVLNREKPTITIIVGYSLGTLKVLLRSLFTKSIYIIWSGSIIKEGRNDSSFRIFYRKKLLERAAGCIAYGQKAKEYLISLGVPENRIQIAINTVDTKYFWTETERLRCQKSESSPIKHLTYIGYIEPRKNVMRILEVVRLLSRQRNDFVLDIVGDGSDLNYLKDHVEREKLVDFVHFYGFKQKGDLPEYLAKSNCFLFQTDFDIWGLVLNEAMAAGVPCISSINAGSTYDLIKEGETGFAVDFNDIDKVSERISWILDHPADAKKIGLDAAHFIKENASINKSAAGFISIIEKSITNNF